MKDPKLSEFIEQLSSDSPTPGGGAAAAYATAMALSLALMSINVSKKRKKFLALPQQEQDRVSKVICWLNDLQKECFKIQESDEKAFEGYMKIYKSDKKEEIEKAAFLCYNIPFKLLELNFKAIEMILFLKQYIVSSIISDYKMALEMCCSNIRCCIINMTINIKNITDKDIIDEYNNSKLIAENAIKRIVNLQGEIE